MTGRCGVIEHTSNAAHFPTVNTFQSSCLCSHKNRQRSTAPSHSLKPPSYTPGTRSLSCSSSCCNASAAALLLTFPLMSEMSSNISTLSQPAGDQTGASPPKTSSARHDGAVSSAVSTGAWAGGSCGAMKLKAKLPLLILQHAVDQNSAAAFSTGEIRAHTNITDIACSSEAT